MADEATVAYVVVGVLPDYREWQVRLKALQARLANEDWGYVDCSQRR